MKPDYWLEKWKLGDTAFHRATPHPKLVRWFPSLSVAKSPGKVMVPLCGKSPDLLWLRAQGHEVVGVELSAIACDSFFEENKIPYRKRLVGALTAYEADGLTLWCGDFFDTPAEAWAGCTALYDRAALVALPAELRRRYAEKILASLTPAFREMLLIVVEYPPLGEERPPHSVWEAEINELYGAHFEVRALEREPDPELSGRRGVEVQEIVYALRLENR